jgi:uncharacterized membrane protein
VLLLIGVLLWSATHLFVALGSGSRLALIDRLGKQPYRGLFSLLILLSVVLMVLGWRAMPADAVYLPPPFMRHVTMLLMPFAVILFIAARAPTNLKQWIRHPQLTGVKLWAVAHLLSNGEARSLILFGGLLAWAVAEVIVINRRDGAWVKPAPVAPMKTVVSTLIALALTAALVFAHPWISGMPLFARG